MRTIECEDCGFACTEDRSKDYILEVDIKDKDGRDECKLVCIDCYLLVQALRSTVLMPPQNKMPKVVAEPRTNLDFAQSQQPNGIPVGQEH